MTDTPTPGPWSFEDGRVLGPWLEGNSCLPHRHYLARVISHGNGPLMAAAPDLLESLKALLYQHDHGGTLCGMALQDARAAVAKAEGDANQ